MWHDLQSERLGVTQFSKVWYHNIDKNKITHSHVTWLTGWNIVSNTVQLVKYQNGIIEEKNILHIHMWCDLLSERLWVTQFSKVSQWYHRRKE